MKDRVRVAAVSGGKDSSVMVLRLLDAGVHLDYLIHTPTGDEHPAVQRVLGGLEDLAKMPVLRLRGQWTLSGLVGELGTLPGVGAARWCCHALKRRPVILWLRGFRRPVEMLVGFRCDEPKRRGYRWPEDLDVTVRFPLREWKWSERLVKTYLAASGLPEMPYTTNCLRCPQQRLSGWWRLWKERPGVWTSAECQEQRWGGTFRHPGRDTWPASLREMRARFEAGDLPRGVHPEEMGR